MSEQTSLLSTHNGKHQHHLSTATVSMLAIGGTIGTGLFFSVASLIVHGPLMALLSMFYVAFLVVIVLEITAELAVAFPGSESICRFQYVLLGKSVGLSNSIIYWLSWGFTYALELSLIVSICSFWSPEMAAKYQTTLILLSWMVLTAFNLLPVDLYGQIEFWIALVKVVAIGIWIVTISVNLAAKGDFFHVWIERWPISFTGPPSEWPKKLVAFINCLIFSSFIFQSVESIAITTGDISEPHITIPKVTKIIFVRIVVFYLASVFLLTVSVPFSDANLTNPDLDNLLSSPFLIALLNCGFQGSGPLLSAFNFVILSAIVSAANSNVYFGSRFLEAMVEAHGKNTKWRTLALKNKKNVPVRAVLITSSLGLFSLLLKFQSVAVLFSFLLKCCASAGMLMWLLLCLSHIQFCKVLKAQGKTRQSLKYCSKWRLEIWGWFAFINLFLVLMLNGFTNYWDFSLLALVGSYMTPLAFGLLLLITGGYKDLIGGSSLRSFDNLDLNFGN